jgi:hypothetical protein
MTGDLDLMISSHSRSVEGLLTKLTNLLSDKGYLRYKLWHSSKVKKPKRTSFKGMSKEEDQNFDTLEKVHFRAFGF